MNNRNLLILIVLTVIIFGGVLFVLNGNKGTQKTSLPEQGVQTVHPDYKITPIIAPFIVINVSDKGFDSTQTTANKGILIHFINDTNKNISIVSGENKIEIVPTIDPGKTGISLPLFKTGEYNFSLKDNPEIKGKIIVR